MFETSIGEITAQGLNLLVLTSRERYGMSPVLSAAGVLGRIDQVIGARMAERFGPPPE